MTKEKVLIKSSRDKNAYKKVLIYLYSVWVGSAFLCAFCVTVSDCLDSFSDGLEFFGMAFWLWLLMFAPFILLVHFITKKTYDQANIVVTNYKIVGSYGLKGQMNIPIDSVSSVVADTLHSHGIGFTCAGNEYKVYYIENRNEIIDVVNKLITERVANKSQVISSVNIEQNINNDITTELRKYKSLLDDGLITQEEYDTKKKQLLEL